MFLPTKKSNSLTLNVYVKYHLILNLNVVLFCLLSFKGFIGISFFIVHFLTLLNQSLKYIIL